MSGRERELLLDAFDSNWIAPLGPHVDAFEKEFEAVIGRPSAALSSGTAALHLALILAGVQPGDEVVVPTLTFVATANAVTYVGATPIFVDSGVLERSESSTEGDSNETERLRRWLESVDPEELGKYEM